MPQILATIAVLLAVMLGPPVGAYEAGPVAQGAKIAGVVTFTGTVPPPVTYKVTMGADPEYCKAIADARGQIAVPQALVSGSQTVAEAAVFLQEVERGKPVPKVAPLVTIEHCRFGPRLVAGVEGQRLRIAMRDRILHQIRGWEMLERGRLPLFHLAGMKAGEEQVVPLKIRRSGVVKLECDQHRFMQAWLLVAANPYVAVTDTDGRFELTDVPPGTHALAVWHPVLGYQELKVTVTPGHTAQVTVTLSGEQ